VRDCIVVIGTVLGENGIVIWVAVAVDCGILLGIE
jgi:hypothetical protein